MATGKQAEECEDCKEGALICSQCEGSGYVSWQTRKARITFKCDLCRGAAYWPCPYCSKRRIDKVVTRIKKEIAGCALSHQEKGHLFSILDNLRKNKTIRVYIKNAEISSVMSRINRHDLRHALLVTENAVKLFKYMCLPKKPPYFPASFSCSSSLEVILISAFCHDVERRFENHAQIGAVEIAHMIREVHDNNKVVEINQKMTAAIQSCIYHHCGDKKLPGDIEETILTLADGLDCGRHRVQPFFDETLVLNEDKFPIEYFSNKGIDGVDFYPTSKHMVEFVFHICDTVGIQKALGLRKRIRNTMLDSPTNKDHFVLKVVYPNWELAGWKSDTLEIWPQSQRYGVSIPFG